MTTGSTEAAADADDQIVLRAGRPADAEPLAAYHHRCWVQSFSHLVSPGAVDRLDPWGKLDRFRRWLEPGSEMKTVVAEWRGKPIGHTTVSGNELVHLFIDPDHQGKGLGRRLLQAGESLLADAGHTQVELHTMVGNDPAIALYLAAGWTMTDRRVTDSHDDMTYDEHVLVKDLAA